MKRLVNSVRIRFILVVGLAAVTLFSGIAFAQGRVREVVIPEGGIDIGGFPAITVRAIVSDDTRSRVVGLAEADFTLTEDGQPRPVSVDEREVGVQVVFVLDASASTRQAGSTGHPRFDEAKQVIYGFEGEYMAEGVDQVAVLAPASSTEVSRIVPLPDASEAFTAFKNTVHDGTYLYELPEGIQATPLNDMISTALNMLAVSETGMHRAVVVVSDGIDVMSDRAVNDIVNKANQLNIPVYTVIFGPPNNWGGQAESNMKRLSLDTFGEHFQLASEGGRPASVDDLGDAMGPGLAALYDNLSGQGTQYFLSFTSQVDSPGVHEVGVSAGGQTTKSALPLNLKRPEVSILQPVSGEQITRQTDDPNLPMEQIEPTTQTVLFDVAFPDGFQRDVQDVELLVDGAAVLDSCAPPCNEILWSIAQLPAGQHSIRVRVRDQQGLEGESDSIPLNVALIVPTPIPPPTVTPIVFPTTAPAVVAAAAAAALSCEEQYSGVNRILKCNQEFVTVGALFVSLMALVLVVIMIRRPPQVVSSGVQRVKDATQAFSLDRSQLRGARDAKATLEVLEGDDSYTQPIEVTSGNTRMGRDEELVQVVFQNPAVSRLHARITAETDRGGRDRYVLYDEGSTSGSYVNWEPVGMNGQTLQHDDIIHLGPVRLQFKIKGMEKVDHEDTVAVRPDTPVKEEIDKDAFATAPYEAVRPQPEPDIDDTQPFAAVDPSVHSIPTPPPDGDDDEGLSTEPYVPMDFSDE